jgi:hypothetical protein
MTRFRISLLVVLWLGTCAFDAVWALGQDQPGGNPPSQRGGRAPDGRAQNRPSFSPEEMLKSLDTNGNGMLEEDEIKNSPSRLMIEGILMRLGIEAKYPIAISEIVKGMESLRRAQRGERTAPVPEAAAIIRLEVVVGEMPAAKTGADAPAPSAEEIRKQMEVLFRAELTTLDNQPAFVQAGRREARVTGVTVNTWGRTNNVTLDDVGTIVKFTPHVLADRSVNVQLNVTDLRPGPMEEGVVIAAPTNGEAVRSPIMEHSETNTTLHIANGETVVVSDVVRTPKTDKPRVILVTAHVLPIGGEAKPAQ